MGRLADLVFITLPILLPNISLAADFSETKCGQSQKTKVVKSLQTASQNPTEKAAAESCSKAIDQAFASCLKTIPATQAAGTGTQMTHAEGQKQEFENQKQAASKASALSAADQQSNQVCATQSTAAKTSCSNMSSASGAKAEAVSYAEKITSECNSAAQMAATNTQNLDQVKKADEELSPSSDGAPSPAAATPSPASSPANAGTGYQASSQSSSPSSDSTSSQAYSSPNFNGFGNFTFRDPDGTESMNSIGTDSDPERRVASKSTSPSPAYNGATIEASNI